MLWMVSTRGCTFLLCDFSSCLWVPSLCSSSWLLLSIPARVSSYKAGELSMELGPDTELEPPSELPVPDLALGEDLVRGETRSCDLGVAAK